MSENCWRRTSHGLPRSRLVRSSPPCFDPSSTAVESRSPGGPRPGRRRLHVAPGRHPGHRRGGGRPPPVRAGSRRPRRKRLASRASVLRRDPRQLSAERVPRGRASGHRRVLRAGGFGRGVRARAGRVSGLPQPLPHPSPRAVRAVQGRDGALPPDAAGRARSVGDAERHPRIRGLHRALSDRSGMDAGRPRAAARSPRPTQRARLHRRPLLLPRQVLPRRRQPVPSDSRRRSGILEARRSLFLPGRIAGRRPAARRGHSLLRTHPR